MNKLVMTPITMMMMVIGCGVCRADTFASICGKIHLAMSQDEAGTIMGRELHMGDNYFQDGKPGTPLAVGEGNCNINIERQEVWSIMTNVRVSKEKTDQQYMDDIISSNYLYYLNLDHADFHKGFGEIVWGKDGEVNRRVVISHWDETVLINDFQELPTKLIEIPIQRGEVQDLIITSEPK